MATVIEFKLQDLVNAVISNKNYSMQLTVEKEKDISRWAYEDADGNMIWEETPIERKYLITITTQKAENYSFDMTIQNNREVYFWFVDSQYNDNHIELLNELEVPYQRV